jgi:secernin
MCDIIIAMPDATKNSKILFGKNSDRPAGECQPLSFSKGGKRNSNSKIQCSYLTIPQSGKILSTMGCKLYWSWGYETGMNEAGVVGGNVAVFTRSMYLPQNRKRMGLNGMELLRLGLERGESAEKAVDIIIQFLEKYGQWGSAVRGQDHKKGSYENSFLLADKKECWVLETSGRKWVADRVTEGVRAISNQLSIGNKWTKSSTGIIESAHDNGWYDIEDNDFNFAYVYGDHEHYSRQVSHIRWKRSNQLLNEGKNNIDKTYLMNILRDHYESTFLQGPAFHQFLPDFHTLCMHDSPSKFTWGNTASSVVIEIDPDSEFPIPFWLCYLPPCSGVYMVFFLGYHLPEYVLSGGKQDLKTRKPAEVAADEYANNSLWWRFQRIIEAIKLNPQDRYKEIRILLDPLEQELVDTVSSSFLKGNRNEIEDFVRYEVSQVLKKIKLIEKHWNII